jgi:hypothetical protein
MSYLAAFAAGGAAAGAGQGIAAVGQEGLKEQGMQKENDLAMQRETAIQRLQQTFQSGEAEKQRGFETERTKMELQGRANVAHFEVEHKEAEAERGRQFTAAQNKAKLASEEARTGIAASGRILSAEIRGGGGGSKGGQKGEFTLRTVSQTPTDPRTGKPILGAQPIQHLIASHVSGQQYMQVGGDIDPQSGLPTGGKMVLYDAKANAPVDLRKYPRPAAAAISDLVTNPDPSHANAFQQRYGYLPSEYLGALHAKQTQTQQGASQLPIMNLFGPGSKITKTVTIGGGGGSSTEEMQDNTDNTPEAPSEADTSAPNQE